MDARLNFLQKIGERLSEEYSINWDSWEEDEGDIMSAEVDDVIKLYEGKFHEFVSEAEDLTEDEFEEFNEILEELLSGYTLRAIFNRKKAIEDLLVSV